MTHEAFQALELLAENGDPDVLFRLAVAYTYGDGVADDNDKAFALYIRAAELGHVEAAYNLGICYHYGYGTQPDPELAYRCYKSAAERGFGKGMVLMGRFYAQGIHVNRDVQQAARWYRLGMEAGVPEAAEELKALEKSKPEENLSPQIFVESEGCCFILFHPDKRYIPLALPDQDDPAFHDHRTCDMPFERAW